MIRAILASLVLSLSASAGVVTHTITLPNAGSIFPITPDGAVDASYELKVQPAPQGTYRVEIAYARDPIVAWGWESTYQLPLGPTYWSAVLVDWITLRPQSGHEVNPAWVIPFTSGATSVGYGHYEANCGAFDGAIDWAGASGFYGVQTGGQSATLAVTSPWHVAQFKRAAADGMMHFWLTPRANTGLSFLGDPVPSHWGPQSWVDECSYDVNYSSTWTVRYFTL